MSDSKKLIGSGISITTGFDVGAQLPLDLRTVVKSMDDLAAIPKDIIYEGLLVYVINENKLYQWKKNLLDDGTLSETCSWGPIEAEVSTKDIKSLTEILYKNTPTLLMQKNKKDFFPVTNQQSVFNEDGINLKDVLGTYQKKDVSSDENGEKLETEMQTIVGAINELNSKMEDTIEDFENKINQTIEDLNASVERMQKETSEDMAEMKANLQAEINKVLADLDAKSKEMDQEFANLLAEVNRQVTELQNKIQEDVDKMLQDVDNSILSDAAVNNFMEQINANLALLNGGGGAIAASFESYSSTVIVNSEVTEVSLSSLGISVNAADKLFVHLNSVYLVQDVDYNLETSTQKIKCINGSWNPYNIPGCEFAFDLIKKVTTIQ